MQKELLKWYRQNRRELPWRKNRDPYAIWISEVMLQQTTVAAVIPYYEKFMKRFPKVADLARANEAQVTEMWAGLGYYSRARNLHKAAKEIAAKKFPTTAEELIELPGFGPYTANAVASLAFNQKVGVLDGNVIRVLSRVYGLKLKWWMPKERQKLQALSHELAQTEYNSEINQGLMELGATVCTPKKPLCLLCPWKNKCESLKSDLVDKLPLSKPKTPGEIWHWHMTVQKDGGHIYLIPNETTPFLAGLPFPKGSAKKLDKKPEKFDIKHSVTKYDIYIQLTGSNLQNTNKKNWIRLNEVKKHNPSSLMTKILKKIE
ncbi:MAG: A/G-specific adenine glycosylase [Pseudobdellovibrio sp.]|jgi:A/G-specific adenine glycosylase|nr:A/G-specific adenine glycosylase [Pseudobdellovibrio sp.]